MCTTYMHVCARTPVYVRVCFERINRTDRQTDTPGGNMRVAKPERVTTETPRPPLLRRAAPSVPPLMRAHGNGLGTQSCVDARPDNQSTVGVACVCRMCIRGTRTGRGRLACCITVGEGICEQLSHTRAAQIRYPGVSYSMPTPYESIYVWPVYDQRPTHCPINRQAGWQTGRKRDIKIEERNDDDRASNLGRQGYTKGELRR